MGDMFLSHEEHIFHSEDISPGDVVLYRVEKNGLQNMAKQDPGRAWQNM